MNTATNLNLKSVAMFAILLAFILFSSFSSIQQEQQIDALQLQLNTLTEEHEALLEQKETLEQSLSEITGKYNAGKASKEELALQIAQLQEKITSLTAENAQLRRRIPRASTASPTPPGDRVAFLTFDDGPSPVTVRILNTLKAENVRATFFVNGRNNEFGRSVYRRIVNEGHAIGNHTYSHQFSHIYSSAQNFKGDVIRMQDLVRATTGVEMDIFRFPGGSNNTVSHRHGGPHIMPILAREIVDMGFQYFDWNVSSLDAERAVQDKNVIIRSVLDGSRNRTRAIILMHDAGAKTTTADALPAIISGLRDMGFRFEVLTRNTPPIHFIQPAS